VYSEANCGLELRELLVFVEGQVGEALSSGHLSFSLKPPRDLGGFASVDPGTLRFTKVSFRSLLDIIRSALVTDLQCELANPDGGDEVKIDARKHHQGCRLVVSSEGLRQAIERQEGYRVVESMRECLRVYSASSLSSPGEFDV